MATKWLRVRNPLLEANLGRSEKNINVRCWKNVVEIGSGVSVTDRSDALQMFWESAIDCLTVDCSQN